MTTYSILISGEEIPVLTVSNGILVVVNSLLLLIPSHIHLNRDADDEFNFMTVGQVNMQLSKQTLEDSHKKFVTLREETFSNEID